jgi:hypothetical protein
LGSLLRRELPACIVVPASSTALREQLAATDQVGALADVNAAILIPWFSGRSLKELCAMGVITLDDLSQGVAYREIFGQGRQEVPIRSLPLERLAATSAG